jgi:hypothetical protein
MGACVLTLSLTACAEMYERPEPPKKPVVSPFAWSASEGQVGRMLVADLKPREPIRESYSVTSIWIDEGELPPGLRQDRDHIEGRLQKAGQWTLSFRVQLAVGKEQARVVQYVPWTVNIAPAVESKAKGKAGSEAQVLDREGALEDIRQMRRLVQEIRRLVLQLRQSLYQN